MVGEVLGDDGQGEGWLKIIDKWRGGEEVCVQGMDEGVNMQREVEEETCGSGGSGMG